MSPLRWRAETMPTRAVAAGKATRLYPPAVPPSGVPRLLGRVWGQRAGHAATSAHVQAAYPFMAEGGLGGRGTYIGRDASGGSFVFDAFVLYASGVLTNPNMLVIGEVGSRKSSLVKTLIWRDAVFGRQAWVIDPKREYDQLAHALGVQPIRLAPGGRVRLNPLDAPAGQAAQLSLLRAVTAAALERPLTPEEEAALNEALRDATTRAGAAGGEVVLPDVVGALLRPTEPMAAALATTTGGLRDGTREAALALRRLCEGDLAGMFDAPTTVEVDLTAPLVVLDLSALRDSTSLGILMACATAWLQARIDERRQRTATTGDGQADAIKLVIDEAWRVLGHVGIAEWLQAAFKLSRAWGVQNVIVMHRFSDLTATGDTGSRVVKLAEGLLSDTQTRVVYRQVDGELEATRRLAGLTDTEAERVLNLRAGEAIWKVGSRSFHVQHIIGPAERALVDTDQAMRLTHP